MARTRPPLVLGSRRRGDEGMALVAVLGTMVVVSLLLFAVLAHVIADTRPARAVEDSTTAMAAAQAGIDDYLARLAADDAYWTLGNTDTTANQAFTTGVAVPGTSGTGGRFSYRLLNSKHDIATSGTIQLQVTGTSAPPGGGRSVSRTLVASLKTTGFLNYLYFTDVEATDPDLYKTQAVATSVSGTSTSGYTVRPDPDAVTVLCSRQHWAGRTTASYTARSTGSPAWKAFVYDSSGTQVGTIPGWNGTTDGQVTVGGFCSAIVFNGDDTVNGPMHSNDVPLIAGSVDFSGDTTVFWPASGPGVTAPHPAGGAYYLSTNGSIPNGTPTAGQDLPMPTGNQELLRYVQPKVDSDPSTDRPGCLFRGATKITFTGPTMTVLSPNSPVSPCLPAGGSTTPRSGVTVPPVIYVQAASGTCTGVGYPLSGERTTGSTTDYNPCRGTVFVSGQVGAQVTVGAADDIVITGDLTYTHGTSGDDVLGLVAANDVWVYHPVDAANSQNMLPSSQEVHYISAAILSLKHSFVLQNHRRGAALSSPGNTASMLNVTGAIAQKFRGPMGTSDAATGAKISGYLKNYVLDPRFVALQPPYFIRPSNTPWTLTRVSDG